jgi:hypothetical protein
VYRLYVVCLLAIDEAEAKVGQSLC